MSELLISGKQLRELVVGFRKIIPRQGDDLRRLRIDLASGTVTATDGSRFLSHQLGKPSPGGGRYLMAFDGLLHFCNGLPARQEVRVEATTGGRIRFRAPERQCFAELMAPGDSFAEAPRRVGRSQTLHPEEREAVLRALTCVSTEDHRHTLQGVFFDREEGSTKVVATDGRCLYHETLRSLEVPGSFILPASPLLAWRGFRHDWGLEVSRGKKEPVMIRLSAGPWTFITPAIEGNYPDWRQILPELHRRPTRLALGQDDLKTLGNFGGDKIGFNVTAQELRFLSHDPKADRWSQHLARDSRSQGPATTVYLDPRFLGRALRAGAEDVYLAGEYDPILFRGKGELVVMPLRVGGPALPVAETKPPTQDQTATAPPKTMEKKPHNPHQDPPGELALETLKTLKGQLRESAGLVDQALRHLREAQARQRATQKDIKTIRGTLQSLKKVAFPT
jgi:hypothetical protein